MTESSRRRTTHSSVWRAALALLLLGSTGALHAASQTNYLRFVRPVLTKGTILTYNIYLYSSTEFPMRDEIATLAIGKKQFINSSYTQGGNLHTICFTLTKSQYEGLVSGNVMAVFYGQYDANNPPAQWNFGRFTKPSAAPLLQPVFVDRSAK